MSHAIRLHTTGAPKWLTWEEVAVGDPAGRSAVRHSAVGVNYIDTYHRSGLYKLPRPRESATRQPVLSRRRPRRRLGRAGDRVGTAAAAGRVQRRRVLPADRLVKLRRRLRSQRGDADVEGAHGPVPVPSDQQAQGGDTICSTRRPGVGPHRLPVGGRWGDMIGTSVGRKAVCEGARLHAHDRLRARKLSIRSRSSPGARACRSSTTRGQGHVSASLDCLSPAGCS